MKRLPTTPARLTTQQAMRMALGPGSQFVGPTERILQTISCPPSRTDRYCRFTRSA